MTPDTFRAVSTGLFAIVVSLTVGMAAWHSVYTWTAEHRRRIAAAIRFAAAIPLYVGCIAAALVIIPAAIIAGLLSELGQRIQGEPS